MLSTVSRIFLLVKGKDVRGNKALVNVKPRSEVTRMNACNSRANAAKQGGESKARWMQQGSQEEQSDTEKNCGWAGCPKNEGVAPGSCLTKSLAAAS
jgi:hypothetical protein